MPPESHPGMLHGMQLSQDIAALAARAGSLTAFREGVLDLLATHVPHDAALSHAGSPRVPLETGVFRGLDLDGIRATLPHWDRYAVELGRFRDVAMQRGGVATDREALPDRGPARRTFEKAFGGGRVRAAALVHLVVRERVVGMVALLRRRGLPFSDEEVSLLRSVAPAIATGDALHQALDGGPRARMPVRLVCRDQRLTERQREIVEHVALGHTNAAIGQALGLSPNTVRNLLAVAMRALGAANRADVVRLAVLSDPGTGSPSQTPEIIPVLDTPRRSRATGSTRRHENVEISPEPL